MNNRNNRSNRNSKISTKLAKKKEASLKPIYYKRLIYAAIVILFLLTLLIVRIAYLQFVKGGNLKERASRQQTTSRILSPNRGTIYDSTGKVLAQSASVDTITINPSKIKNNAKSKEKSEREKEGKEIEEKVARAFSNIFELEYDDVLEQVRSDSSVETIVRKVEQDKVDELTKWMEDNKISSGINIDPDFKRYYPYGNLASNLIGFCNIDNNGQEGLELKWDSLLSGTPRKNKDY